MSRSWNGAGLLDELTALLGDTSEGFRAKCLGWMNDTIFDIATRHDWGHHLVKGKKLLIPEAEIQSLEIAAPEAPEVGVVSGGGLTSNTSYKVLVTFLQDNGVESMAGEASEEAITSASDLSIEVSSIPVADDSLVTSRKIYLQKDGGKFYFFAKIADNYSTELTIDADTSSTIEPPDYEAIRKLKGAPFLEGAPSRTLAHRDIDQLRLVFQGNFSLGVPEYFAPISSNSLVVHPLPSEGHEMSFNFYRYPHRIYDSADSSPDLPINLKPALKSGVVALGYEYRDRAGQEMKKANYENALVDAINRGGRVANIDYTVRDVYGNLNGYEVG